MDRTVKEIARELGTNKNVIYRIISKHNLAPVPTDNPKESKRYDNESYLIIQKEYEALREKHGEVKEEQKGVGSDNSDLITELQNQIERKDKEIERLNKIIEDKDATIKELVKSNHLETIRYQELFAREQTTKLLTAQAQTRFNLFKPSTWKKHKAAEAPDLNPLTESAEEI